MKTMQTNNNPLKPALLTLILTGLLPAVTGCDKPPPAKKPQPPQVIVTTVTQQTVPIVLDESGTVQSIKSVNIIPRVSGYVFKRYFTEGTFVKEGAPLYLIDPRPYQATLDSATAQLALDQANLKFWTDETRRLQVLADKNYASQANLEKVKTKMETFQATIKKDQADIENDALNLSFTKITAPFSGRMQNTQVHVGDLVHQQQTVMTTILAVDPIYVVTNISRSEGYQIQKLRAEGMAPDSIDQFIAELIMPNGTVYPHQGVLSYFSAQLNPNTDTFTMRYQFPNPTTADNTKLLTSGQYIPLRMTIGHHPNATLVPQKALLETQEGTFIYVVKKDDTVEKRAVTKGPAYQQSWVIEKGLKAGERIVAEGILKIPHAGVKVTPMVVNKTAK